MKEASMRIADLEDRDDDDDVGASLGIAADMDGEDDGDEDMLRLENGWELVELITDVAKLYTLRQSEKKS
jgi:hypothetical protein